MAERKKSLSGAEAVTLVRDQLPELLGRPVEAVLGMERNGGKEWTVSVQVVELARIPNSTDVLGIYAATVDEGGELTGYHRVRRCHRSQADDE